VIRNAFDGRVCVLFSSRHDYRLAGRVIIWPPIEAAVDGNVCEAGSGEEMFHLVAKEVAHTNGDGFFSDDDPAAAQSVAEGDVLHLLCEVAVNFRIPCPLQPVAFESSVFSLELVVLGEPVQTRGKDIEGHRSARHEMPSYACQAGELIFDGIQMLECA